MSLKVRTVKGVTTLMWTSPTMEASWKILPEMTEKEVWEVLTKATVFVGKQIGVMPEVTVSNVSAQQSAMTVSTPTVGTGPADHPVTRVPMMPLGSLSDKPSDGGPPRGELDQKFWESMPTLEVPGHLATGEGAWEMDPEGGAGW